MLLLLFAQVFLCQEREGASERERGIEQKREWEVSVCVRGGGGGRERERERDYYGPSSFCTGLCLAFPSHLASRILDHGVPPHLSTLTLSLSLSFLSRPLLLSSLFSLLSSLFSLLSSLSLFPSLPPSLPLFLPFSLARSLKHMQLLRVRFLVNANSRAAWKTLEGYTDGAC